MPRDPETRPGDRPERAPRRTSRRLPFLGDLRLDRRLRWIVAVYLVVIAGIVGYNAKAISKEVMHHAVYATAADAAYRALS